MLKKLLLSFYLLSAFYISNVFADTSSDKFSYPFYAGIMGGYGSTTWGQLVPSKDKNGAAISMSAPVGVSEGGAIWGIFAGYEFIPQFAFEASYERYPNAKVSFDPMSLFTFEHNGLQALNTHTETASLMAKAMVIIPHSTVRGYSSVGVAGVHRYDQVYDRWLIGPAFGAGFNYNITPHIMTELGANFTAGYGESELDPAEHFVPFLYSVFLRLGYRF